MSTETVYFKWNQSLSLKLLHTHDYKIVEISMIYHENKKFFLKLYVNSLF